MQHKETTLDNVENGSACTGFDDDGRPSRTGTLLTTTCHIVTCVIGSGVLSLAWATAQLGWLGAPLALLAFAVITLFCSSLLADCYRYPDPVTGKRNYTYQDAVRTLLGNRKCNLCALAQYVNLVGATIGYTITTSISMSAVNRSNCFHKNGHEAKCEESTTRNTIIFGVIQIFLSQIPNFHKLWWLSIVAAVMSVAYSSIGFGLSIAKVAEGVHPETNLTGAIVGIDVSQSQKIWNVLQSLGNIAFAYGFSLVLFEIQDTLKSIPPENQVMKKASMIGLSLTTSFYMLCGLFGYAAFGNKAPGNFLTGFGFYEPYWLIDLANICIAIHLYGAYQVLAQPFFQFFENWCRSRWPNNAFLTTERSIKLVPLLGDIEFSPFRLVWRTIYVIIVTVIAFVIPFFNDFLGLIGSLIFWPITVYFPIEMYIARTKLLKYSARWIVLEAISVVCFIVTLLAFCASIQGIVTSLAHYRIKF